MDQIKAVIIDDELKLREVLKTKLERHCPEVFLAGQAEDATAGYKLIVEQNPQLVFLDIAMPVTTGFEMLEKFDTIHFEIIFVTGYDEYALDAFKVSAVDYLLKPVNTKELQQAVQKAIDRINKKEIAQKFEILKHNLKHPGDQNAKVAIPGADAYDLVLIKDIVRCEGWQKYTKIFLTKKKTLISSYNIGVFRDMFKRYQFFSTHKSHLINQSHIQKYLKEGVLVMSDQSEVPVSRRRREVFFEEVIKQ